MDFLFWALIFFMFVVSVFRTTFQKRYLLDYWSYTLMLVFFVPFIFQYWFAGSILNVMSVGGAIISIQKAIPLAFHISFTGLFSFFVGACLCRNPIANPIRKPVLLCVMKIHSIISSPSKGRIYAALMLTASLLISAYIVSKIGFGFKARDSSLEDNSFRPLLNLNLAFLLPVSTLILTARALAYRRPSDIMLGLCAIPMIMITGTKGAVLSPIMTLIVLYVATSTFSIKKTTLLLSGLIGFVFLIPILNSLRRGSGTAANPALEFLYGNAFSDLRDFAWFLAYWDGALFQGMTYLAGLISFLPRVISPFREKFAYGVVTATTVGFSPLKHAGIRIGVFGEPYINFGWIGVIAAGVFMGISIRCLYRWIYVAPTASDRIIRMAASMYVGEQVIKIGNSSSFFALHGFFALLIGNEILCRASTKNTKAPVHASEESARLRKMSSEGSNLGS